MTDLIQMYSGSHSWSSALLTDFHRINTAVISRKVTVTRLNFKTFNTYFTEIES
jgi:hypothetical protein